MALSDRAVTEIQAIALRFRACLDLVPRGELPFTMSYFPSGACGDTSLLLGAYLADNGFKDFRYISGDRGSKDANTWTSHAWLACGSLVVDITADQFDDAPVAVIVAAPSPWHQTFEEFEEDHPLPSDFREWHGLSINELAGLYARLTRALAA
jgi:hypothetical protein